MIAIKRINSISNPRIHDWLVECYFKALQEEIAWSVGNFSRSVDLKEAPAVKAMFASLFSNEDQACAYVAFDAEEPVGYFIGLVKECIGEQPRRIGYLNGLYIVPESRGQGIGCRLLASGSAWFRSQGLDFVELYLAHGNEKARSFWKTNGYVPVEEVYLCDLNRAGVRQYPEEDCSGSSPFLDQTGPE